MTLDVGPCVAVTSRANMSVSLEHVHTSVCVCEHVGCVGAVSGNSKGREKPLGSQLGAGRAQAAAWAALTQQHRPVFDIPHE